ncbi:MAG TPA: hypothetical protein VHI98_16040 [Vicinamibacterales bacterium]|nr:hypothetical protein [Vicinamibacterales bacterium]
MVRRSGRNYPQHLYFSLHVHAAWFFCGRRRGRRADQDHSDRDTAGSAAVGIAYMALVLAALIAILYPLGLFRGQ